METENDALAAVLHAVRRGGVSASAKVARHYRDEAELGLERSIQHDFNNVGRRHIINTEDVDVKEKAKRRLGRHRHIAGSLVKCSALSAIRSDSRSRCFQGCAYLIAGRPENAIRILQQAGSSTRDPDLASAIDLTLASAYRNIGSMNEWLDSHMRCAARRGSSLRVVGGVFATIAALRTENRRAASMLLDASYEASPEELRAAYSELARFVAVACSENPMIVQDLKVSLRRLDVRGLWVELLEDATS